MAHDLLLQTWQQLDEFCLVMEMWFSANGCPYKVLDEVMTCYVWSCEVKGLIAPGCDTKNDAIKLALTRWGTHT